jgi:hypothetical protein
MAFASPGVFGVEHGLSLLPGLEERWCVGLLLRCTKLGDYGEKASFAALNWETQLANCT